MKLEMALYEGDNLLNKKRNSLPNATIKTSYCILILKTENSSFLKAPLHCKVTVTVD